MLLGANRVGSAAPNFKSIVGPAGPGDIGIVPIFPIGLPWVGLIGPCVEFIGSDGRAKFAGGLSVLDTVEGNTRGDGVHFESSDLRSEVESSDLDWPVQFPSVDWLAAWNSFVLRFLATKDFEKTSNSLPA